MNTLFPTTTIYAAAALIVTTMGLAPVLVDALRSGSGEDEQLSLRGDSVLECPEERLSDERYRCSRQLQFQFFHLKIRLRYR